MYKLNVLATNRCNAQLMPAQKDSPGVCAFCFRQETDIDTNIETVVKVVKRICELPFEEIVTITGGEPLLSRFIIPLINELNRLGKRVSLHTNGILLEKYLETLNCAVEFISLPFDGHRRRLSNYYRGVGYYDLQQRNFKLLKENGIKIGLHTLLTPYNYNEIENMAFSLLRSDYYNSIWYWFIRIFKRMNLSLKIENDVYTLEESDYLSKVESVRNICHEINIYPTRHVKQRKPIFIDLVGNVYILNDHTSRNTLAGNILNDDFDKIESFLISNGAEM